MLKYKNVTDRICIRISADLLMHYVDGKIAGQEAGSSTGGTVVGCIETVGGLACVHKMQTEHVIAWYSSIICIM